MAAYYPASSSSTPPPYASTSTSTSYLGQTRSRTLLFLSYRDSAGPSSSRRPRSSGEYAPYSDNDHPLSSSLNEDTDDLLPRRRSREGHVSIPVSELPPRWMDIQTQVDEILSTIRPRMDRLSRLHEKHLRPGFSDKSDEEKKIESLALDITKDFRRCSRLVAGLASFTQSLIRDSKRTQSDVTIRQIALAQNVQTALATRIQDLSGSFRKQQSLYLRRMKGMEVRDRDIRAAHNLLKDSEVALREDLELSHSASSSSQQSNLLLFDQEQSSNDLDIQNRTKQIDEIAKSIQELATLFGDLQTLVIDQGTMLDRIDYNVELMSREMKGAVEELETATRYQRRSGRRSCILFLCLLIALLVAIIIIKPFWRVFAGSPSQSQGSALADQ